MTDAGGGRLEGFDALYRAGDDPWSTDSRWYESRKRAILLALLPTPRFARVYEAGCGNANLSVPLAARCDALIASDGSDEALRVARERLADVTNVTVVKHVLPRDWPDGTFDLVVFSEVLYFLSTPDIDAMARRARESTDARGTIVACNWRAAIEGYGHTGDEAHRRFESTLGLPRLFDYRDDDVVIGGWSATGTSVATREGMR